MVTKDYKKIADKSYAEWMHEARICELKGYHLLAEQAKIAAANLQKLVKE